MLLGRTAERAEIAELLNAAKNGRSGALLLRGEAGMGKTTLLNDAVRMAEGMTTLRARGVESESELPYSGLAELLHPVLDMVGAIPQLQAGALRGALAIGPPVGAAPFAVCAATLSLMATVAEDRPLLAIVDDLQWMDASSLGALAFTARRIQAEGIALLLAERSEGESRIDHPLPQIDLHGLDEESSLELLASTRTQEIAPDVGGRVHKATGGNPLAVLEVGALLTDDQLMGRATLDDPLPLGERLESVFLRRVSGLTTEARTALLVVAASETGDLRDMAGPLRRLSLDARHLASLEERGLIEIHHDRIEWRHPLHRSAVYHAATTEQRRRVHAAIADGLVGRANEMRRAWHRAASVIGPDEQVASQLERAGHDARRRLGHAEAARAFERAARLTEAPETRARRLLAAGRDLLLLGQLEKAIALLDEAIDCTRDARLRAEIQHQRGSAQMWVVGPAAARSLLVSEAEQVVELDPARAAMMLAEASVTHTMDGNIAGSLALARRAEALALKAPGPVQIVASALVGGALVIMGRAEEGRPLVLRTREVFEAIDPLDATPLIHPLAHVALWLEEYDVARRVLSDVIDAARLAGAIGVLPYPLACSSELEFRLGRWGQAYAAAHESAEFARRRGLENQLAFSLVCLAAVEGATGREEPCRQHVSEALQIAESFGTESIETYGRAVLGLLELGLGHPLEAIPHLERAGALVANHGVEEPGVVEWAPDLITAYAAVGRADEAENTLDRFHAQAERTGRVSAIAAAARCRGLLDESSAGEEHFEVALRALEKVGRPFERARTQLLFGRKLRRARRAMDAREPLRDALATFESLGARPWGEQAGAELVASGGKRRASGRGSPIEALGPQEMQVALLVADGLTNREIAASMFLSPKTIEFHLGKIYRKLSLRSRTELARLIAETS